MKKIILTSFLLCVALLSYPQEKDNVIVKQKGDLTEATYYYQDGSIQQKGTFNKEGELHGEWISYDPEGNKLAVGKYVNGQKHGKWFFWTSEDVLKEVDYLNSKITSVNEWKGKTRVAVRNR